ncbi:hypothetical protein [Fructilactobacillus fructivorans]|uniref:DUF4013 domain-containing protein n=2 Tax=Fructilactobacillus fructivorans TaxID=1614 RepID=A0A0C1PQS4_9LACO|nr:hypothetical protein [Fructilactobacillus fructivorans]KID42211.1 hypothetical protein LfDm3_0140 [Fructilactobacillus fructivorans]KRK58285.1 hypothetical protein FC73_GL000671 [Fructilactobacillus fructivorans]KRN42261.1 hypothetical protein IV48_GL000443 [Fructilactobacillus fructivorans]MCT0151161.1 hypothetical protein [Fructilactobacillus fructivorans]MCT2867281.1 hypothetical protein [Fructilactobacillus fructivorans]
MIANAMTKSWEVVKKHWWMMFLMGIPAGIVGAFSDPSMLLKLQGMQRALFSIFELIVGLVGILFSASLAMGYAKSMQTGSFKFKNAFVAFNRKYNWPVIILVGLLMALAEAFATLLFIVPGVILSVGWGLWMYSYQDNIEAGDEVGITQAFTDAWKTTKGYKWNFFGLQLLFFCMYMVLTILLTAITSAFKGNGIVVAVVSVLVYIPMIIISFWNSAAQIIFYREIKK